MSITTRKTFSIRKAEGSNELPEGQIWFIASKEEEDRDRDVISIKGIKTGFYQSNPVFLWAHNQKDPSIGKCLELKTIGDELHMLIEFDMEDEFAAKIYSKYKRGFLNAVSIGFMATRDDVEDRKGGGLLFKSSELLELSGVPIPSNRNALQQREFADFANDPEVRGWAKSVMAAEALQDDADAPELLDVAKAVTVEEDASAAVAELVTLGKLCLDNIAALAASGSLGAVEQVHVARELSTVRSSVYMIGDLMNGYRYALDVSEVREKGIDSSDDRLRVACELVEKAGRVISTANYRKLRTAHTEIGDVLESAADPDEAPTESKATEDEVFALEDAQQGENEDDFFAIVN